MTTLVAQRGPLPRTVPGPSAPSGPFWARCREGTLGYQRCPRCDLANFPPVPRCRRCQSPDLEWRDSAGRGSVYSWTTVWRPVTPAFVAPYVVAILDVAEGYQMVANIIGCEPEGVRLGMAVEVTFEAVDDELTLPYFRPVA